MMMCARLVALMMSGVALIGCGDDAPATVGAGTDLVETDAAPDAAIDAAMDVASDVAGPIDTTPAEVAEPDPCPRGFELCDDRCVDKSIAPNDCGECGVTCGDAEHCRQGECVTGGVLFSLDVNPLLKGFGCVDCHSFMTPAGLVGVATRQTGCRGTPRVAAGDPDGSAIIQFISGTTCGMPMPPTGKTMSDDEISLVRRWIEAGALDN